MYRHTMELDIQLRVLCIISCYVCSGLVSADDLSDKLFENKVDQFVLKGMLCNNNPGLSLAVVQDGRVRLAKGYGFKSTENLEPVTNRTLFQIASLSKAFAATLMLKQIEESKNISLSTTVRAILDNDDVFNGYLRSRYTTLEDLMAHRMGIPSNNNIRLDDKLTRRNLVQHLKYLRAVGGFRTSFYYSNLIYGLLTYLSEVIGGSTWENLVTAKLFKPLGMTSSTFVTTANPEALDMAIGYQDRDGELLPVPWEFSRRWGELCGSGCVISNAVDMAKWMLFHLSEGRNARDEQVLDPDLLAEAHKPQNSIPSDSLAKYYTRPIIPVTFNNQNYGLGWRTGFYRGFPTLSHTGSTYGYRATLLLIPKVNIGVFVVMTGDDPSYMFRTNIQLYITDLLTGHAPWLSTDTVCTFPEPWQRKKTKPSTPVDKDIKPNRTLYAYEGFYQNKPYGDIDIYYNKTSGYLTALFGFAIFDLYPKKTPDHFYAEGYGLVKNIKDFSTLIFEMNSKGTVEKLVAPSMESKRPPEFKRIGASRTARHVPTNDAQGSLASIFCLTFSVCLLRLYNT